MLRLQRGRALAAPRAAVPGQGRGVLVQLLCRVARGAPCVAPSARVGRPELEHSRRVAGHKGAAEKDGGEGEGWEARGERTIFPRVGR